MARKLVRNSRLETCIEIWNWCNQHMMIVELIGMIKYPILVAWMRSKRFDVIFEFWHMQKYKRTDKRKADFLQM